MKKIIFVCLATILCVATVVIAKEYITGYDQNNNPVKVERGIYVPGISATPVEKSLGSAYATFKSPTLLDASTASTTSSAIDIKGAKKVSLFITDNIRTSGKATSTWEILVSGDDTNYFTFYKLYENAATSTTATFPWISGKTTDATTTTAVYSLNLTYDTFSSIKASTTQTYGPGGVLGGLTIKSLIEY